MSFSSFHYFPLALPFLLALLFLFGLLIILIEIRILEYAYAKMGMNHRYYAPPLAYISGSLGTMTSADLLNLDKIQGLGIPIVSIGGAGTFDGIFLTGILAVLLAGLVARKSRPR